MWNKFYNLWIFIYIDQQPNTNLNKRFQPETKDLKTEDTITRILEERNQSMSIQTVWLWWYITSTFGWNSLQSVSYSINKILLVQLSKGLLGISSSVSKRSYVMYLGHIWAIIFTSHVTLILMLPWKVTSKKIVDNFLSKNRYNDKSGRD